MGDANLFDPLVVVGAKEAGGGQSDGVMVEDLLGGFSEMVAPDSKPGESNGPTNSSATSFFLLDLDSGGGDTSAPNFMIGKTEAARPTSAVDSISDNSEVLSITEATLPMGDAGNDALMSGFFNDVLQADSVPDGATLANAATVQVALHSATTSSETTLVGARLTRKTEGMRPFPGEDEDILEAAADNAKDMRAQLIMGASEENLDSIMDLEVPVVEPARDLFDTTEVEPMVGGGRLVKVSTVENLVTGEEGVIGGTVTSEVVKQLDGGGGDAVSDVDVEHPLASELRPIFEMFDTEGKGWIGVDQLEELCRSQGQVVPRNYSDPENFHCFLHV